MTPHATQEQTNGDMSNGAPLTNGETPRSRALSHLQSYPVVHDSVETFKSWPIGAKSLNLANNTYQSLVAPFHPYLQTPYSWAHPYLTRADELSDNGLSRIETHFPVVKQDTDKLKEYALSPYKYLTGTYHDQYQKTHRQDGLIRTSLAIVSTELQIVQDAASVFLEYWNQAKSVSAKRVDEVRQ